MVDSKVLGKVVDSIGTLSNQLSAQLCDLDDVSDEVRAALSIALALLGKARGDVHHAYLMVCMERDALLEKGWEG